MTPSCMVTPVDIAARIRVNLCTVLSIHSVCLYRTVVLTLSENVFKFCHTDLV